MTQKPCILFDMMLHRRRVNHRRQRRHKVAEAAVAALAFAVLMQITSTTITARQVFCTPSPGGRRSLVGRSGRRRSGSSGTGG